MALVLASLGDTDYYVDVVVADVTADACGLSSEALELRVEGRRVWPSYGQGRYGVVPPRTPDILAICVQQNRLPHHTIGRQHPQRFPPNAASVKQQGDDHCESEPSRFRLGKGRFGLLILERCLHLQPHVLDGRVRQEWRMKALRVAASSALSG